MTMLVAAGAADVPSQRLVKHFGAELVRRGNTLVTEAEAQAALGRPLSEALADCSGDDLCFVAIGQALNASFVVIASAAQVQETTKYECTFRIAEVKTASVKPMQRFVSIATEQGLIAVARAAIDKTWPRPAMTAVATPLPPATATPTPLAAATAVPTPAAGIVDQPIVFVEDPPIVPRVRKGMTRDPAFWGIAGAGLLVLGIGGYFGAAALQPEPDKEEGTTTVGVRF